MLVSLPDQVTGKLSIDKVTFLLYSPALSMWTKEKGHPNMKIIDKLASAIETSSIVLDEDFPQGCKSDLFLYHYRTDDGIDIQFGAKMPVRKRIKDEDYIKAYGTDQEIEQGFIDQYFPSNYGFRVEYNPNKTSLMSAYPVLKEFSRFRDKTSIDHVFRLARLDIALDYPAKIVPQLISCSGMRKSGTVCSSSQGIQTTYFGARGSKFMFRIYDKKKEQLEEFGIDIPEPDLWRIELESKRAFNINEPMEDEFCKVFKRLAFYSNGVCSDDWQLNMIRENVMHSSYDAAFGQIPKTTRYRLKKKFSEVFETSLGFESPEFAFKRQYSTAYARLKADILTATGFC